MSELSTGSNGGEQRGQQNHSIKVQNKIHYAVSGETAAEVIYHRADAEKEFMGLMNFAGEQPTLREAKIAKNYLNEKGARHLDGILTSTGEKLLIGAGSVSHEDAMAKAETEYRKYRNRVLSSVEKDYLQTVKALGELSGKE